MPKKMAIDDSTKAAALKLLEQGLVTRTEAAWFLGISRQLVSYWAEQAGIDCAEAREAYLRKLWARVSRA